jgi:hypothetical protein
MRCTGCGGVVLVPSRASPVPTGEASSNDAVAAGAPPAIPRATAQPARAAAVKARPDAGPGFLKRYLWLIIALAVIGPVVLLCIGVPVLFLWKRNPAPVAPVPPAQPELFAAAQPDGPPAPPAKVKVKRSANEPAVPAVPAVPVQPAVKDNAPGGLPQKAQAILRAHCYRCHGRDGENEGGLNYVLDLHTLVSRNKVVPGKPDDSLLFQRITADRRPMPPRSETPRPSEADIATLKQWIAAGAPALDSGEEDRDFITDAEILKFIHDDLQKLEERKRRFTRYFTITHLYNAGRSDDELQTFRLALSKLVNSLSWERDIEVPQPIDRGRTILRIDLRHYQWGPEVWKAILKEYPYGVTHASAIAKAVYAATDCDLPHARADWFVYAASRPPLYHGVLQLPQTDRELEQRLAVDVDVNIRNERVARAGFNSSGVSSNNRLVERHRSGYGAYWKSYDFAHNQERKNLFAHPLGPASGSSAFDHDGGEIIFSLPNGLQAYLLTDARGNRIDKGPTTIVRDDRQPDRAVVNGVSCMSCHAHGMIDKTDQVREHVERNAGGFTPDVVATVRALYPPREKFAALLKEDADRFAEAVRKTGAHLSATEPIAALALRYTYELDLPLAAAEAGLDVDSFRKALARAPQLARTLGPLSAPGGTVQRDVFVSAFQELAHLMLLEKPAVEPSAPQPGVPQPGVPQPGVPAAGVPVAGISGDIFVFIDTAVKQNRLQVAEKGFIVNPRNARRDMPAGGGGILIGFNVGQSDKGPWGPEVSAVQPIYLTRTGEKLGQWFGPAPAKPLLIKAKPGYVVGALHLRTGAIFDAFAVTFVRFDRDHMLPKDTYASAWVGGTGGNLGSVGSSGTLIVGVTGHTGLSGNVCALGIVTVRLKE